MATVATALGLPVGAGTSSASADGAATRQAATAVFEQRRPSASTGVRLAIDYVNPDDAEAKPHAVQRVVIALAPGTSIDTSVPARCAGSNAELMAMGPTACPVASRVGQGEIDLDTGVPGPARILQFDVTMFNNTDELILLLESAGEPQSRVVARSVIDGATLTTDVSPVPGGPPDGFTAIKRVRLHLEARSTGHGSSRRAYVATPSSCPDDRTWLNSITFTYRDGVSQTTTNASRCTGR